jgi:hypothetical protein
MAKSKWIVSYWDDNKDKEVRRGFDDYEQAITLVHKIKKNSNREARIELR